MNEGVIFVCFLSFGIIWEDVKAIGEFYGLHGV